MQSKKLERQEARRLRELGWSVPRIASTLGVAKSSVSVWVRDLPRPAASLPGREPPPRPVPTTPSGELRRCSRCRDTLPVESFNRAGAGRQWWCRDCFRSYFRERGDVHRHQVAATQAQRRKRARELLLACLVDKSCADCGIRDAVVLEFDHTGEKHANVARLVAQRTSSDRILAEMAQCDVVCVNCHRRRTARRGCFFRHTREPRPTWTPGQIRNQAYVLDVLEAQACVDCGEGDPVVLEFDHRADKRGDVSKLAAWGVSIATLRREIAKCDIRCANCHRRRTLATAQSYRVAAVESSPPP